MSTDQVQQKNRGRTTDRKSAGPDCLVEPRRYTDRHEAGLWFQAGSVVGLLSLAAVAFVLGLDLLVVFKSKVRIPSSLTTTIRLPWPDLYIIPFSLSPIVFDGEGTRAEGRVAYLVQVGVNILPHWHGVTCVLHITLRFPELMFSTETARRDHCGAHWGLCKPLPEPTLLGGRLSMRTAAGRTAPSALPSVAPITIQYWKYRPCTTPNFVYCSYCCYPRTRGWTWRRRAWTPRGPQGPPSIICTHVFFHGNYTLYLLQHHFCTLLTSASPLPSLHVTLRPRPPSRPYRELITVFLLSC
ncbi:hypothetical protein DFH09DRAFT_1293308 [Mycena vulgaris]|nr:hypothetical protein DFH09DRAFT_1293308 [Mycena vulgaris]